MCGSLRREHQDKLVGHPAPIVVVAGSGRTYVTDAIWNGHARIEKLASWYSSGWSRCQLQANSYTEGHDARETRFPVPRGKAIACVTRLVGNNSKRIFNILTREAKTSEEKQVHNRFPVLEDSWA